MIPSLLESAVLARVRALGARPSHGLSPVASPAYADYFAQRAAYTARRAITQKRQDAFLRDSFRMLMVEHRPLDELVALTDFVFDQCRGVLPIRNDWGKRQKLTRPSQIRFVYDDLLAYMREQ